MNSSASSPTRTWPLIGPGTVKVTPAALSSGSVKPRSRRGIDVAAAFGHRRGKIAGQHRRIVGRRDREVEGAGDRRRASSLPSSTEPRTRPSRLAAVMHEADRPAAELRARERGPHGPPDPHLAVHRARHREGHARSVRRPGRVKPRSPRPQSGRCRLRSPSRQDRRSAPAHSLAGVTVKVKGLRDRRRADPVAVLDRNLERGRLSVSLAVVHEADQPGCRAGRR